jgi:hypothetical protein
MIPYILLLLLFMLETRTQSMKAPAHVYIFFIINKLYILPYAPEKCPRTLGTKVMVMCTQLAEKLSCRRSKHITRKRSKTYVYWCANVFVLMPLHYMTMYTKIGAFDG